MQFSLAQPAAQQRVHLWRSFVAFMFAPELPLLPASARLLEPSVRLLSQNRIASTAAAAATVGAKAVAAAAAAAASATAGARTALTRAMP